MSHLQFVDDEKQFSETSDKFNTTLTKKYRQDNGIFFTPASARNTLFEHLRKAISKDKDWVSSLMGAQGPLMGESVPLINILEPSFGSGEFLDDILDGKWVPDMVPVPSSDSELTHTVQNVVGVELDKKMWECVKENVGEMATLINGDFTKQELSSKFNLIIGNPPYFVIKEKYPECFTGRGNMFIVFLYKCIVDYLAKDGFLAFVLPTSLYNCVYYEKCRKMICEKTKICHLEELTCDYYETKQDTMLLILQNKVPKKQKFVYTAMIDGEMRYFITPLYKELRKLSKHATTLKELGFQVRTGEVVWNENKKELTDDEKEGTVIIYTSNIVNNEIKLGNLGGEKKQYIKSYKHKPQKGPAIFVSRGYGNKYQFSYTYLRDKTFFYAENHINVIKHPETDDQELYERIIRSFGDERTMKFIKAFSGNGAISKTELENVVPIY